LTDALNNAKETGASTYRNLRLSIVIILVLLTIQGWTGDFTNLFAVFPVHVASSLTGIIQVLYAGGILPLYHAFEGFVLMLVSIFVLILSFRFATSRPLRVFAILGFASIISAGIGGIMFLLSDFNNAFSAQMGGSFIGAYAFYFLALYYTKN
jgi:hypothetical protein